MGFMPVARSKQEKSQRISIYKPKARASAANALFGQRGSRGMRVVSYSGGLGSFMAAYMTMQAGYDMELVFCDVRTEDADLYRFLRETSAYFQQHGVPLITLDAGMNIWEIQRKVKMQANSQYDPCSRVGKRDPFKKYMREKYPNGDAILVLGIDATEAHRTKDFERNHAPYRVDVPLCSMPVGREEIIDVLDLINIKPPRLYDFGFSHNNCGGFCVKAGQKQASLLLKSLPDTYAWHEAEQEKTFAALGERRPTIRKQVDGTMYYLSLRDFREFLEDGGKPEMWEEGKCACF